MSNFQNEIGSAICGFLSISNDKLVRLAACGLARNIFDHIGGRISQLTDQIMKDLYRALRTLAYDQMEDYDVREKGG